MKANLTIQDWLDAGYKRYNNWDSSGAEFLLQKRFDDEYGKKYFINIRVFNWKEFKVNNRNPHLPDYSFAPDIQFQFEGGERPTMNVELILSNDHTIETVEKEFENLWILMGKPYYEVWET